MLIIYVVQFLILFPYNHNHILTITFRFVVKEDSSHTIGVEFGSKIISVGGKAIKLQVWDTAGY